jgi:protein phosphatase
MKQDFAVISDPGLVRANNEDAYLTMPEVGLFAVADGMGGHNAGEVASALAVKMLREDAARLPVIGLKIRWWRRLFRRRPPAFDPVAFLHQAVARANRAIFEAAQASPETKGMGTTVAAMLRTDQAILTAHVGDSRIYRFRDGRLSQLTQDHSLAQELVRKGVLSPEEAMYSAPSNVLTRALGVRPEVQEEIAYHSLEPGDLILLGSDGLSNMVEEDEMLQILARKGAPVREKARNLIAAALKGGGEDNVTAVVVQFADS